MLIMKYKYFLIDADDTIFDFIGAAKQSLKFALNFFDIPYRDEYFSVFKSKNDEAWREYEQGKFDKPTLRVYRFSEFFKTIGIDCDSCEVDKVYFDTLCTSNLVIEGAIDFLKQLKKRGKIYLITNGTTAAQNGRIKASGIGKYFNCIFISDEIGVAKPKKEFFDIVLNTIKKPKENCVVIGDSLSSDITGANNAGVDCIWFNNLNKINNTKAKPDYIANSYDEILRILDAE